MTGASALIQAMEVLGLKKPQLDEESAYDLAAWNLACAQGLPGSEAIDHHAMLEQLDRMAQHVDQELERNYHHFLREPERYGNSQTRWCALMLITVLQQDFGVQYNAKRIRDPDFRNSADLFIYGMLGGEGGTCASMPVLYTAIGRRLGWPINLAHARGHVFCRWDDLEGSHPFGSERFNIEGSSQGGHLFDDEYYRTWPEPIAESDIERGVYLRSLMPEEELASFLALRGHCLFDNRRISDARDVYRQCRLLAPHDPHYEAFHVHAELVRDQLIEKRALEDYFGPNVPLPFGVFPKHVLQKLAAEMMVAELEYFNAQRSRPGIGYSAAQVGMGWGAPSLAAMGYTLPARLLRQCNPALLMHRRQEASALIQSLPPGAVIQQPYRISLDPPTGQRPNIESQDTH